MDSRLASASSKPPPRLSVASRRGHSRLLAVTWNSLATREVQHSYTALVHSLYHGTGGLTKAWHWPRTLVHSL